jgi:hypothetical protein
VIEGFDHSCGKATISAKNARPISAHSVPLGDSLVQAAPWLMQKFISKIEVLAGVPGKQQLTRAIEVR